MSSLEATVLSYEDREWVLNEVVRQIIKNEIFKSINFSLDDIQKEYGIILPFDLYNKQTQRDLIKPMFEIYTLSRIITSLPSDFTVMNQDIELFINDNFYKPFVFEAVIESAKSNKNIEELLLKNLEILIKPICDPEIILLMFERSQKCRELVNHPESFNKSFEEYSELLDQISGEK